MNRREGEDEPCRQGGRSRDGALDLLGEERLQHGVLVLSDLDPAGGAAEEQPVPLSPGEQGSQGNELIMPMMAVHGFHVGKDVVAGHFPQVVVAVWPLQRANVAQVEFRVPGGGKMSARWPRNCLMVRVRSSLVTAVVGADLQFEHQLVSGPQGREVAPDPGPVGDDRRVLRVGLAVATATARLIEAASPCVPGERR